LSSSAKAAEVENFEATLAALTGRLERLEQGDGE